jgi:hypothetical protein
VRSGPVPGPQPGRQSICLLRLDGEVAFGKVKIGPFALVQPVLEEATAETAAAIAATFGDRRGSGCMDGVLKQVADVVGARRSISGLPVLNPAATTAALAMTPSETNPSILRWLPSAISAGLDSRPSRTQPHLHRQLHCRCIQRDPTLRTPRGGSAPGSPPSLPPLPVVDGRADPGSCASRQ